MRAERIAAAGIPAQAARAITGGIDRDLGITATGSGQTDAYQIRAAITSITGGAGTTGVVLRYETAGDRYTIFNNSGSDKLIYPPSGGAINGGSANAAITLGDKDVALIQALNSTDFAAVALTVTALELAYLDGLTAGTVSASKAVVVDANKDISEFRNFGMAGALTFGAGSKIDADSGTVTLVSNAGTVSKMAGVITTESLTTAAGSSQALTITNTLVAAGDIILLTRNGGTNTGGTPQMSVVAGSGSFTITIDNKHASAAFNGTFIIGFLHLKA